MCHIARNAGEEIGNISSTKRTAAGGIPVIFHVTAGSTGKWIGNGPSTKCTPIRAIFIVRYSITWLACIRILYSTYTKGTAIGSVAVVFNGILTWDTIERVDDRSQTKLAGTCCIVVVGEKVITPFAGIRINQPSTAK